MVAIGASLIAWSVFLSWVEEKAELTYVGWFNAILGLMVLVGFILLTIGLGTWLWEVFP